MELKETDLVMVLPASFAVGEPGEPFSDAVVNIIRAMVPLNYWPLAFGEAMNSSIELYFCLGSDAGKQAEFFIKTAGVD